MRTTILFLACLAACSRGAGGTKPLAARWDIDEAANLAVPVCAGCGAVLDRGASACAGCGKAFVIEAKTIPCPECAGAKTCAHCDDCPACEGTHACALCDGTGTFDGAECPDCGGDGGCPDCAAPGEHCSGTAVCANCNGTGSITLR